MEDLFKSEFFVKYVNVDLSETIEGYFSSQLLIDVNTLRHLLQEVISGI